MKIIVFTLSAFALAIGAIAAIPGQASAQDTLWTNCDIGQVRLFQRRLSVYCTNTERYYSAPTTGGGVDTQAAVYMLTEAKARDQQVRIRFIAGDAPPGSTNIQPGWRRPPGCSVETCFRLTGIQY